MYCCSVVLILFFLSPHALVTGAATATLAPLPLLYQLLAVAARLLPLVEEHAGDAGGGDVNEFDWPRPKVYSLLYTLAFAVAFADTATATGA